MVIPLLNWYLNNEDSRKTLYFYNVLQFPLQIKCLNNRHGHVVLPTAVVIPLQNRYLNNHERRTD